MEINKLSIDVILSILATSLCLSGWFIMVLSFFSKIENYVGKKYFFTPPKVFLLFFLGSITFSLSDIYTQKWWSFLIQIWVSGFNLGIYIIQRQAYNRMLENEIR